MMVGVHVFELQGQRSLHQYYKSVQILSLNVHVHITTLYTMSLYTETLLGMYFLIVTILRILTFWSSMWNIRSVTCLSLLL